MRAWFKAMCGMAGVVLAVGVPEHAAAQPARVYVFVHNNAGLPTTLLGPAQAIASSIYETAGIRLEWVAITRESNTAALPQPKVRIRILARADANIMREKAGAIAFTPVVKGGRPTIAYVLETRVTEVARRYGVPDSVVLGAVMAHELGHLLLPDPQHTRAGVMRDPFNQSDFIRVRQRRLQFTAAEAQQLQASVAARSEQILAGK